MNHARTLPSSRPSHNAASRARARSSSAPDFGAAVPPLRRSDPPPAPGGERRVFLADVARGLTQAPKRLPASYLFDGDGSELFARLAETPEHHLVRSELSLVREHARELADLVGEGARIIDLATGDGTRVSALLEHVHRTTEVVLADRLDGAAERAARALSSRHPELSIVARADATTWAPGVVTAKPSHPTVIYLGGSVVGELEPRHARAELRRLAGEAGPGALLVVGLDLRGDPRAHEAAYADRAGVATAFNRHLLARVNAELGATFDVTSFEHRAVYDAERGRVELRLVSRGWQWVAVGGQWFNFGADEPILTMVAYKYTIEWFAAVASIAGSRVERVFTAADRKYALVVLRT